MNELEPKPSESVPERGQVYPDEQNMLSFLDILLVIARNRQLIVLTVVTVMTFGLLIAIFSTPKYTATAQVIREITEQNPLGGLA